MGNVYGKVSIIIPALDEEESIGLVMEEIPKGFNSRVIVVDNGSKDGTAREARAHGAEVVFEPQRGYGAACLKGLASLDNEAEVVVFLDGDHSDYPEEIPLLLAPIDEGRADVVIGSRVLGRHEEGSLTFLQRWGNWLATGMIAFFWGFRYTDLGPFRAIRRDSLKRLNMSERGFGWTVEMQIKALRCGLRVLEVPVRYRRRIGKSKISGTLTGSIKAGAVIIFTVLRLTFLKGL